jgi:hypothetical protein
MGIGIIRRLLFIFSLLVLPATLMLFCELEGLGENSEMAGMDFKVGDGVIDIINGFWL